MSCVKRALRFALYMVPLAVLVSAIVFVSQWANYSILKGAEYITPVIQGIIGGVITALMIFMFSFVWKSNLLPWFEHLIYKDTKIEGIWEGVLVPYIGNDKVDRMRTQYAFSVIRERKESRRNVSPTEILQQIPATLVTDSGDVNVDAEIVNDIGSPDADQKGTVRVVMMKVRTSGFEPIKVRAEIFRTGHKVSGQIVEIGGASQIHTYKIEGSFRNLILAAIYENEGRQFIDRGSLSLMLVENGNTLSGFFSSYADSANRMIPFRCELKRQNGSSLASRPP